MVELIEWVVPLISWIVTHEGTTEYQTLWDVRSSPIHGVGLFATKGLAPETELFVVPEHLIQVGDKFEMAEWVIDELVRDSACDMSDDREQCLAEIEEGDDFWLPYLNSLPEDEFRHAKGSILYEASLNDDWEVGEDLVETAIMACPSWVEDKVGYNGWLLTLSIVVARMHKVWIRDDMGDLEQEIGIVPLADLMNSANTPGLVPNVMCGTRQEDAAFRCWTTKDVAVGEELLVTYGDDHVTELSMKDTYGFDLE